MKIASANSARKKIKRHVSGEKAALIEGILNICRNLKKKRFIKRVCELQNTANKTGCPIYTWINA